MITKITNKVVAGVASLLFPLSSFLFTACEDFFEQESDDVLYADKDHLNNSVDSIYSVTGIMNKLQVIADRTILFGEVRGDLVTLTNTASSDLRELAEFNVGDDNKYNSPRDYYDIINNCNYFLAKVQQDLKSNRNEYIFMKEYAAVKAFRAWTYLQLVLNYGRVPFVTEPILNKEDSEKDYPMYDLEEICQFFLNDLSTLPEEYNTSFPGYRTIRNTASSLFYFPLSILRGELNLWLATSTGNKNYYRDAAFNYYKYISERNGTGGYYSTGLSCSMWSPGSTTWSSYFSINSNMQSGPTYFSPSEESSSSQGELITMIPGDSIPAEGYYSELRNLFNSTDLNDSKFSITPSKGLVEISESQVNCVLSKIRADGTYTVSYAPKGLDLYRTGDLRLRSIWKEGTMRNLTGEQLDVQTIAKYQTRNVHIWRRQMVYLRMAEAINMAGYPRMAFQVLSQGLTDRIINNEVYPYYTKSDSVDFISKFKFSNGSYKNLQVDEFAGNTINLRGNTMGIHTHGSGWTPDNAYYQFPDSVLTLFKNYTLYDGTIGDTLKNVAVPVAEQQAYVDSLILNESALEFAFEGTRYYDVMRYALRQPNPGATMEKIICNRRGKNNAATVKGEIKKDLTNKNNWFLNWNGKIGF